MSHFTKARSVADNTLLTYKFFSYLLHCTLASGAVYCNRSCLCVCGCVCGARAGGRAGGRAVSVTTITRNCVHRSSGSDHLQLIKFWRSCAPGRGLRRGKFWLCLTTAITDSVRLWGSAAGRNFSLRLTTASAQCLRLSHLSRVPELTYKP